MKSKKPDSKARTATLETLTDEEIDTRIKDIMAKAGITIERGDYCLALYKGSQPDESQLLAYTINVDVVTVGMAGICSSYNKQQNKAGEGSRS